MKSEIGNYPARFDDCCCSCKLATVSCLLFRVKAGVSTTRSRLLAIVQFDNCGVSGKIIVLDVWGTLLWVYKIWLITIIPWSPLLSVQTVDTPISSEATSPRQVSSKPTSKKMPSLSFHRKHSGKPLHPKATERQTVQQDESGVDHFPGGDAMLEALTRFQSLQDSFNLQLQTNATQAGLSPNDREVLLARATSQAALTSVKDCLALMKLRLPDSHSVSEASPQHHITNDHRSHHLSPLDNGAAGGEKNSEDKVEID